MLKKKTDYLYNDIREICHSYFIMDDGTHVAYSEGEDVWMDKMSFTIYYNESDLKSQGPFDPEIHKFFLIQTEDMHKHVLGPWNFIFGGTKAVTKIDGHTCFLKAVDRPTGYVTLHLKDFQMAHIYNLANSIGLLVKGKALLGTVFWYTDNNAYIPKDGFKAKPIKFKEKEYTYQKLKHTVTTFLLGLKRGEPEAHRLLLCTAPTCRLQQLAKIIAVLYNYTPRKKVPQWICTRPYPSDSLVYENMKTFLIDCIRSKDPKKVAACEKVLKELNHCVDLCAQQLPYKMLPIGEKHPATSGLTLGGDVLNSFDLLPKHRMTTLAHVLECMQSVRGEESSIWAYKRDTIEGTPIIEQCIKQGTWVSCVHPDNPCVFIENFSDIQCLLAFVCDAFPLEKSVFFAEYEWHYFSQLPPYLQKYILDIQITLVYYPLQLSHVGNPPIL